MRFLRKYWTCSKLRRLWIFDSSSGFMSLWIVLHVPHFIIARTVVVVVITSHHLFSLSFIFSIKNCAGSVRRMSLDNMAINEITALCDNVIDIAVSSIIVTTTNKSIDSIKHILWSYLSKLWCHLGSISGCKYLLFYSFWILIWHDLLRLSSLRNL